MAFKFGHLRTLAKEILVILGGAALLTYVGDNSLNPYTCPPGWLRMESFWQRLRPRLIVTTVEKKHWCQTISCEKILQTSAPPSLRSNSRLRVSTGVVNLRWTRWHLGFSIFKSPMINNKVSKLGQAPTVGYSRSRLPAKGATRDLLRRLNRANWLHLLANRWTQDSWLTHNQFFKLICW